MTDPLLSPADRERLEALFDRAAEMPTAEHAAFVARECRGHDVLGRELARLLAALSGKDYLSSSQTVADAPLSPGTTVGTYRLLERVGQGGMGEVYAAEQLAPVVRRVALKVIKRGMDSVQVVARFMAERQALARMTHPHIAQVYDGGTTENGRPYFVMEFVAGDPITEYCDRHKLTTTQRLELFLGICAGVQHAHLRGVIHRDLKPSNLLVTEQDGKPVAKIIDFGVARATTGRLAEQTLHTMHGQIIGTIDYMSPEQADPTALDIDTRSDVYSLGVVLYQLLSGLLPFEQTETGMGPLHAILELDPPTPSTRLRRQRGTLTTLAPRHGTDERALIRQLAGDLDWICIKALEKSPARRYQSVAELAADVRRHLAHEPVLAGPPGWGYRVSKFVRRHRLAVAAGVLIAASAIVGGYGFVTGRLESLAADRVTHMQKPFADAYRLAELVRQADDQLWPPHPDKIPALRSWLAQADELAGHLPGHRADLHHMEASAQQRPTDEYDSRHATLRQLVRDLEVLRDPASGLLGTDRALSPDHGWSIRHRLAFALDLQTGFAPDGRHARLWNETLPAIHAAYPGLELPPQMGLVPIGKSSESPLWEFAHLLTGDPPQPGADGELLLTEHTGVVLILIPAARFEMGNGPDTPGRANPAHHVELSAYFLSKYEMTQSQWKRLTGRNPSRYGPDGTWQPEWLEAVDGVRPQATGLHPIEQVSWLDCMGSPDRPGWLPRAGLVLPSEAQWEHGARAGTSSPFWSGSTMADLENVANLSDPYAWGHGGLEHAHPSPRAPKPLSDGATMHLPVTAGRSNPFGLHNVHGNVYEWCLDSYDRDYYRSDHGPDPVANPWIGDEPRVYRGGSYRSLAGPARSSARSYYPPAMAGHALGVRPARAITR